MGLRVIFPLGLSFQSNKQLFSIEKLSLGHLKSEFRVRVGGKSYKTTQHKFHHKIFAHYAQ